jgi:hypothetical protein
MFLRHARSIETLTRFLVVAMLPAAGCAAMHADRIKTLRASGDHAQADCFERCGHDDLVCLKRCDNAATAAASTKQQQQFVQLATAAAQADAAKAAAARAQPSQASSAPEHRATPQARPAPASNSASAPPPSHSASDACGGCAPGTKCLTYLAGTKQCAEGGLCWVAEKTTNECKAR